MNQGSPQRNWLRFDLREMLALLIAFGLLYWAAIPRLPDAPQVTPTQAAMLVAAEEVETVNYFGDRVAYLHLRVPVESIPPPTGKVVRLFDRDGEFEKILQDAGIPYSVIDWRVDLRVILLGSAAIVVFACFYLWMKRRSRIDANAGPS